jgi:hypothetical protein
MVNLVQFWQAFWLSLADICATARWITKNLATLQYKKIVECLAQLRSFSDQNLVQKYQKKYFHEGPLFEGQKAGLFWNFLNSL